MEAEAPERQPDQQRLTQLMWHPSDACVKPLIVGKRAEHMPAFKRAALPFNPLVSCYIWSKTDAFSMAAVSYNLC